MKWFRCIKRLFNLAIPAAHCVKDLDEEKQLKRVRIGEWNLLTEKDCSQNEKSFCAPPYLDVPVTRVIPHPNYRRGKSLHNDIAVLRLAEEVEFNRFVRPICLPLDQSLWNYDHTGSFFDVVGEFWKHTIFYSKSADWCFVFSGWGKIN